MSIDRGRRLTLAGLAAGVAASSALARAAEAFLPGRRRSRPHREGGGLR
jgi:hypothetical protein